VQDVKSIGDDSDTGVNGVGNTPSRRAKRRSPKKNRVGTPRRDLDDTKEEETGDDSPVPAGARTHDEGGENENEMVISVSGSPPHETKMRQISEGVGGMKVKKTPGGELVPVVDVQQQQQPFPSAEDGAETGGLRASGSSSDDMDQDKMLKRKLGDRAVSESREAESLGNKTSRRGVAHVAPTTPMGPKRSREECDKDKDGNPRDSKRPSPPPEKDTQPVAEPSSSKPKSVSICFGDAEIFSF